MKKYIAWAAFCLITPSRLFAADNLIRDANFSTFGQPDSPWQVSLDKGGRVEVTMATDGKTPALHITAAQVTQPVGMPLGDYELTVQAKGSGELLLGATGERPQMLGKDWGTYGYLFHTAGLTTPVSIGIAVEGTVASVMILPATDAQKAALKAEADERVRVGFVTVSAQRPTPGTASLQFEGKVKPLEAMNQFAVLDDPRLSTAWSAHVDRLVEWLGNNGFARLDADKLPAWMSERITKGDAYGSVVVLPRGVSPEKLKEGPRDNKVLWLEYLRAGGRIVHAGDVPLNYVESPGPEPSELLNAYDRGAVLLGLDYGSVVYCGGHFVVTPTSAFKAWGLENADGAQTGVPVENTTVAFHVYTVPSINKQGATDYFRNIRPDMPWSGLVKILQVFDGDNDSNLRDIWRAAHYVGKAVTIPAMPPPSAPEVASKIQMKSDGVDKRHEFVRGEDISVNVTVDSAHQAGTVRLDLMQDGKTLYSETHPGSNPAFALKTAPYADASYDLQATVLQDGKTVETESEKIGIRYLAPAGFNFQIGYQAVVGNPQRNDMVYAGLHALGLDFYTTGLSGETLDPVVRNHEAFSFRSNPDLYQAKGKPFTYETHPEYYMMKSDGKPVTTGSYSGGRPMNGFTHPDILENVSEKMEAEVRAVAQLPNLRPYLLCNDDFSQWYGFDYSPHVINAFKADTGLDAPRKLEAPANYGAVPDANLWLRWNIWTMINVNGKLNKVETEAATKARSDIKIGPIPGGAGLPLIGMDGDAVQYPPYDFGKDGFNLIASYYYNGYWNPAMATTYWMEVGRIGNHDLPEWNMPDILYSNGYTQNEFYHYMAGGVQGLVYFIYGGRTKSSWAAIKHLAPVVRRVGPVQMELKAAHRDIGMLSSFTTLCFYPNQMTWVSNAEENLIQGHFSVEMVAEEDILAGRASQYKAIYLYAVRYLRQSVYDALAKYAANGGIVLLDATVPFDIPGAKRLNIDTAEGTAKVLPPLPVAPNVPLGNLAIDDYGRADRIALVQKAVSAYIKPQFDSPDVKIAGYNFEGSGVPYTWFVNVQDQKEFMFSNARSQDRTPKNFKEVVDWENSEMAKGPYTSTLVYNALPGIPYDLVSGKKLTVTKTPEGRFAITVSMDRFGGSLIAWYPADITEVKLSAPKTANANANQMVHVVATVMAGDKPLPGVDSVEFTWRDPSGKESIISSVRAAKNGEAIFDWTPAINDPTGSWTLEVKELASGKTAQVQIDLAK